jgi:hypothetical protein
MGYDPKLVAMIINFSEKVIEIEPTNVEVFGRILMKMLEQSGYSGITLEEANAQIECYMKSNMDIDISSFLEYNMDAPAVCEQEMQYALLEGQNGTMAFTLQLNTNAILWCSKTEQIRVATAMDQVST